MNLTRAQSWVLTGFQTSHARKYGLEKHGIFKELWADCGHMLLQTDTPQTCTVSQYILLYSYKVPCIIKKDFTNTAHS